MMTLQTLAGLAAAFLTMAAPGPAGRAAEAQAEQMPLQQLRQLQAQMQMDGRIAAPANNVRSVTVRHKPFAPPITAAKIQTAVDDAVAWLRSQQMPDGSIGRQGTGGTALAALAMLAAGADPASDPVLRKALECLAKRNDDNTYVRGIRANTWEYALRKMPYDTGMRDLLKADYQWLMKALGNKRAWRYSMNSGDWDNSCTQYGVLGVWAAQRAGFDPGEAFWRKMSKHFRESQGNDGGWSYTTGGSTPNMATAGLASMFLVFDMYHGRTCYSREHPRAFADGEAAEVLKSLDRCMQWLGKADNGQKEEAYYLYGIERAGVASGRKCFGGEDWFARGALSVLQRQLPGGAISTGGHGDAVCQTSWCVLFLVYGGAPAAFDKLEYGEGQDWNLNPRDLANLSKHLWSLYERPLNWQSVSIREPASEYGAPVLFVSGSRAARFSDQEALRLREYVERGGTILAEAADRSPEFEKSMPALLRQMFPAEQYPAYRFERLPAQHGVYTVLRQDWKERPELWGVSDGSRTFFFLSKAYMSGDWQMNREESDAFKLAANLLSYAVDMSEMEGRFASILPESPAARERGAELTVARVIHRGGGAERPRDWDAGTRCWPAFAPYARHVAGCKLKEHPAVDLAKDDLSGIRLLHITGRRALTLSAAERAALRSFAEAGGTVLVDAYAGSPDFAGSARREIEAVFGKLEPLAADSLLAAGHFEGGADLSRNVRYKLAARRALRARGRPVVAQSLETAKVNGREAVLFSAMDLTGALAGGEIYGSLGYRPESARRLVGNLVALLTLD